MVQGLGFRMVQGLGFRMVQGLGFRMVQGLRACVVYGVYGVGAGCCYVVFEAFYRTFIGFCRI